MTCPEDVSWGTLRLSPLIALRDAECLLALRPVMRSVPDFQNLRRLVLELLDARGAVLCACRELEAVAGRIEEIDRGDEVVVVRRADHLDTLRLHVPLGFQQGLDV